MARVPNHFCSSFNECSMSGFCVDLGEKIYKCICLTGFVEPNCSIATTTTTATTTTAASNFGPIDNFGWILLLGAVILVMFYVGFACVGMAWHYPNKTWCWAFTYPFTLVFKGLCFLASLCFGRNSRPDQVNIENGNKQDEKKEEENEEKKKLTGEVSVSVTVENKN